MVLKNVWLTFSIILNNCTSIICEHIQGSDDTGCGKRLENDVSTKILSLDVHDTNDQQSVQALLNSIFSPFGSPQEDYRCEVEANNGGCGKLGNCTKASLLTNVNNTMIIQLKIFRNDMYGNTWKIFQTCLLIKILSNLKGLVYTAYLARWTKFE